MSDITTIADFERIYKEYYIRLYRYAYGFVGNIDISKDIVSEVFTKLWKEHSKLSFEKLPNMLFICVRNESMNYLRKQKGMDKYTEYCKASFSEENDDYWQFMEERMDEIGAVIDTMPSKTRFVLEQCYFEEHTYKEVAEMLDISTNGVKKHIMKAFSMLRSHFQIKKE